MPDEFDVFLSHNSRDKPAVEEVAARLRDRGLHVWLDKDELRPGLPWQEGLEEGVRASRSVAVFVGKDGMGAWQTPEMRAFLARSRREGTPVIPVLLPGCPESPQLDLFLEAMTWVDLREGLTDEGLGRLVWGITGTKSEGAPGAGGRPGPSSRLKPPRSWRSWGAALALLGVLLALGAWLWRPSSKPQPAPVDPKIQTPPRDEIRVQEPETPLREPRQDGTPRVATMKPVSVPVKPEFYAVRVQVLDPQGGPVEGATIRASVSNELQQLQDDWWEVEISAAKVPADGRITLWAEHPDWKENRVELRLDADQNLRVEIHLQEPETLLRGQVIDQSGRGVPGARVFRQGGPSEVAIADQEGHFDLKLPLTPGKRVRLRAELADLTSGENFCVTGSDSCSISLEER